MITATVAAACGSASGPQSAATPTPTSTPWWFDASRFVPAQGYITYISNMAALDAKFGAPQPMLTCSRLFDSPTPAGLDGVRAANSHGGLPELLAVLDLGTIEADAGFDPCSARIIVDGTLGFGSPPNPTVPADIGFDVYSRDGDASAVTSRLTKQGYTQRHYDGATVFSKGSDGEIISDKYFSKLDRVAVLPGWVVTGHSTATIQLALDAYAPTMGARDTLSVRHSMLNALGDFDSVAILDDASSSQPTIALYVQRTQAKLPTTWGRLTAPSQVSLAYERTRQHTNQIKVALYYAQGAGGEADATELAKRLDSYQSTFFQRRLCSGAAEAIATRSSSASIVVATCPTSDDMTLRSVVVTGDLGFLIHEVPSAAP